MKAVAYYRVSTAAQGRSGLGLEAQRAAVAELCASRGLEIIAEFTEVESGRKADRPELSEALRRAKLTGATLVVAKLDRLSRSVAFLSTLQDSGAKFIAADMPEANELTVHILAAVAQAERKAISTRTREALRAAKARGVRLGNPNGAAPLRRAGKGNAAALKARKAVIDSRARELAGEVAELRAAGASSLREIAAGLNERRIEAPRGGEWHPSGVRRLLNRLEVLA
ncbi:recombinase family protein [Altererythrobacter arenosus]|uniref:Recombinase family protein n=1 Tax=Altererythrobacter arenosus TaxID=3032592 RepID=A0ABY8FQR5_9SPHN|nr:recombinase family protein [Altererythrobacter sp. CAU 1644]WFL76585.1 recombinase family protein [Altererythrobacter sp. CAU 1644]